MRKTHVEHVTSTTIIVELTTSNFRVRNTSDLDSGAPAGT
jgi:hypothetical protein